MTNTTNVFGDYEKSMNSSSEGLSFYTGLAPIKILAINPTEEELAEIIGEDAAKKFDTDYALTEGFNEETVRPVNIWYQDKEEKVSPSTFTINISEDEVVSRNGNNQLINDKLQTAFMSKEDIEKHPKMGWFDLSTARNAKIGEENLYKLISQFLRWDFDSEVEFMDMIRKTGVDVQTVYDGNFEGLRAFAKYVKDNEFNMIGCFVVSQKTTDDGIRNRQGFLTNPDTWYRTATGEVVQGIKDNFFNKHKKAVDQGRQLSSKYYTVDFQEFNKEDCLNSVPEDIADTSELSSSWI